MAEIDLVRSIAQVVFLACLAVGGYHLPILLTERRFRRGAVRLGESFPVALRRARRWRWLTVPLALLAGIVVIGLTA
ncbi:MAG TPA: hypothetical protein VF406_14920 [Thermodesulfobacteriota bacterium]